jgi:hypothetical protein
VKAPNAIALGRKRDATIEKSALRSSADGDDEKTPKRGWLTRDSPIRTPNSIRPFRE